MSEYRHTHESVLDNSPAMLVSSDLDSITLVNEDGFEWTDPVEQWRRIPQTLVVTTESGRVYEIDHAAGLWRRLPKTESGHPYGWGWDSLWSLKVGTHFGWPWHSPEDAWVDGDPEVGKYMYISSRDVWFCSTRVVSVEVTS